MRKEGSGEMKKKQSRKRGSENPYHFLAKVEEDGGGEMRGK